MTKSSTAVVMGESWQTIGLDLSDQTGVFVAVDKKGAEMQVGRISLTRVGLAKVFASRRPCRVAIEAGTHSPWVSRALSEWGHEVIVANPRQVRLISHGKRKNDKEDAENLARLARVDPKLLHPICHRGEQAQADLAYIRSRKALVEARTALINCARGIAKSMGTRLPKCESKSFTDKVKEDVPPALKPAFEPLLRSIKQLSQEIDVMDKQIDKLSEERYPETAVLRQVKGVGPIVSLTYVLTLEDPQRFKKSRSVGSFLGMVPRQHESGEQKPQLPITKAGDVYLRSVLVQSAQYILGPFGPDCDLRRWGLKLAERGSKNQKKRAITAVARKLAVLLHRLWLTGEVYEPLRQANKAPTEVAA